ncbi:hypothetical protein EYF80_000386 [Liparis tanakae]|uniref:Secreted protein n=1 Tax=Liparis tanakae TaxID=230148 RepID=A0A4Z2JHH2_9TELE|nr:hypothetical protein EYF80_000386 [Liparis tanakae]
MISGKERNYAVLSFCVVLLRLLARVAPLPVDLELVIGPFGAVGVGASGGFADDESRPPAREASPPSASADVNGESSPLSSLSELLLLGGGGGVADETQGDFAIFLALPPTAGDSPSHLPAASLLARAAATAAATSCFLAGRMSTSMSSRLCQPPSVFPRHVPSLASSADAPMTSTGSSSAPPPLSAPPPFWTSLEAESSSFTSLEFWLVCNKDGFHLGEEECEEEEE